MDKSEWRISDKIPIGDFIPNIGKGQQWSYRLGWKDGQTKLLEYLRDNYLLSKEIVDAMLNQSERKDG